MLSKSTFAKFMTGHLKIDAEHWDILNRMHDLSRAKTAQEALYHALELRKLCLTHLDEEELLFSKADLPEIEIELHTAQHNRIKMYTGDIVNHAMHGHLGHVVEYAKQLEEVFMLHMDKYDRQYADKLPE